MIMSQKTKGILLIISTLIISIPSLIYMQEICNANHINPRIQYLLGMIHGLIIISAIIFSVYKYIFK